MITPYHAVFGVSSAQLTGWAFPSLQDAIPLHTSHRLAWPQGRHSSTGGDL